MSRLLILLILLILTGCSSVPSLKVSKCNYQAVWSFPKFAAKKERIYQQSWRQSGFSVSSRNFLDLSKHNESTEFNCREITRMSVRLYKTWSDVLLNSIPFYYSTHVEINYTSL